MKSLIALIVLIIVIVVIVTTQHFNRKKPTEDNSLVETKQISKLHEVPVRDNMELREIGGVEYDFDPAKMSKLSTESARK